MKKDKSFIAAEKARTFTPQQMADYLDTSNIASDERKIHCFLEFLEYLDYSKYNAEYMESILASVDMTPDTKSGVTYWLMRLKRGY
jgi:hypothetical protein